MIGISVMKELIKEFCLIKTKNKTKKPITLISTALSKGTIFAKKCRLFAKKYYH